MVIAVIGCGRIAQNAHFPALEKIEGVRVKYACDLIIEKAEAMKEKYEMVENAITDYKIALADPEIEAEVQCSRQPLDGSAADAGGAAEDVGAAESAFLREQRGQPHAF